MARLLTFALALSCWALAGAAALASGADHPNGAVADHKHWPAGLRELANRPERVHGYYVNFEDVFSYDGDSKAFNEFIAAYGKLKGTALRVVLHPGAKKARSPWDKEDRDLPIAWTLHGSSMPTPDFGPVQPGRPYSSRVDVWLGSRLKLDQLRIPAHIEVVSGGAIEKFIAERQGQGKN
jgi:hypothetical protein